MFQSILVPLDGSTRAEEALPLAARLARAMNSSLILLRVLLPEEMHMHLRAHVESHKVEHLRETCLEEALNYLKRIGEEGQLRGIPTTASAVIGNPGDMILRAAQEHMAQLIVMRSHGQAAHARWLLGSVAQHVVRYSPIPTLVTPNICMSFVHHYENPQHTPHILVALDGSSLSESALLPAARLAHALAHPRKGHIHLTCAVRTQTANSRANKRQIDAQNSQARDEAMAYLQSIEARFRGGDFCDYSLTASSSVVPYTARDDIWKRLLEEVKYMGEGDHQVCDIVALATQGKVGLQRLREGSVTEDMLNAAACPLLIVRSQPVEVELFTHSASSRHHKH
ncbi:universal stress protein [Ktedonospora formicarum]|uniref:Universal stress protein UspA n=1 Tax=Ktedonospora formicarum TaxID=2778364 RepID=A0A8J3I4S1_9CHLR|nr:universal stress protein [Ktedonospora formicarum]GHO46635.1 universal stress protein UspA [Ktedonospora formicarum]